MKRLLHYIMLVYENRLSVISICIVCCAVTIVFLYGLSSQNNFNVFIDSADKLGLKTAVKVENKNGLVTLSDLISMDCVDSVHPVESDVYLANEEIIGVDAIRTVSYSLRNENEILPVKMDDGSYCHKLKANELIMSDYYKKWFNIDDTIFFDVIILDNVQMDVYRYVKVPFKIVGFADSDQFLVANGHYTYPTDITTYFQIDNEEFAIYNSFPKNEFELYKDEYIKTDNEMEVKHVLVEESSKFHLSTYFWIVIPCEGQKAEFIEELSNCYPDSVCYDYDSLLNNFIGNRADEYFLIRTLLFVSVVMIVIMLLTSLIMTYEKRKRDLVLFHMLGATWSDSIIAMFSTHFVGILTGLIIGVVIGRQIALMTYGERFAVGITECIVFGLIVLLIYGMIILPFFVLVNRATPIELYRKLDL